MALFKKKVKIKKITNDRSQQELDRKSYIVHHYCPHTFNAGDHFVIRSIRTYLRKYLPEVIFIPKACSHNRGWGQPVRLKGENINLSNQYADAVIIGGSDQYNNWSLRIKKDEINQLITPLFLIGLGVSSKSLNAPPYIEKESYYEDIRVTNETARLSSVRDTYTQRFLEKLGYNKSVVTGCPSMFLFNRKFHLQDDGFVALTFPFPVVRSGDKSSYTILKKVIQGLIGIIKKQGLKPIISCHDDRDVFVAQEIFPEEELFFSNYVDDFFDFYQKCLMVIGSRLHASILVSGFGKPFININLDVRGKGFSETFELQDWNVDIDNPNLLANIERKIKLILSGDIAIFEKFYDLKLKYKNVYTKFMKEVAENICTNNFKR